MTRDRMLEPHDRIEAGVRTHRESLENERAQGRAEADPAQSHDYGAHVLQMIDWLGDNWSIVWDEDV